MALTRMVYDRELAVSEKRVKPGTLTRYSTLITGKQTVHILPEGYVVTA
jgi:nucleoporin POM152